ncbi:MAG: hypothetical protein IKN65_04205 [Clostridia bacterium]|nr:hypothetical protein [Clostridia bacterium]
MKKIVFSILCTVIASAIVGVNSLLNTTPKEQPKEQLKQETKIEQVDEKIDTEDIAVKDEENQDGIVEKPSETEKNEKLETKSKSTNKPSSSVSNVPKQETPQKQESSSNSNVASTPQQPTQNTTQTPQPSSNTQSNTSGQTNKVSTSFYDSITGGKKEFSSESACFARGTQIQNAELDYVLNYNEQHPEAPIQPEINYFRCYPVIDEQGEGWYLHFFCRSGEGLDSTLKSKY